MNLDQLSHLTRGVILNRAELVWDIDGVSHGFDSWVEYSRDLAGATE